MTAPVTAAWPLQVALAAALEGDAQLQAALGGTPADPRVDSGRRPEEATGAPPAPPFLVLGSSGEAPRGAFGPTARRLHDQSVTIDVYGRTKPDALALYGHLVRVLDDAPLACAGHRAVRGAVRLVLDVPEPDGQAHHAVVRYTATTQAVAS